MYGDEENDNYEEQMNDYEDKEDEEEEEEEEDEEEEDEEEDEEEEDEEEDEEEGEDEEEDEEEEEEEEGEEDGEEEEITTEEEEEENIDRFGHNNNNEEESSKVQNVHVYKCDTLSKKGGVLIGEDLNKKNKNNNEKNLEKKKKINKQSSLKKLNINSINKNYFIKNPVSLFWLGGPLPGLTILHNMKRFSKNTIIDDLIYEGYNENKNIPCLERSNDIDPNYEKENKKKVEGSKGEDNNSDIMEQTQINKAWDSANLNTTNINNITNHSENSLNENSLNENSLNENSLNENNTNEVSLQKNVDVKNQHNIDTAKMTTENTQTSNSNNKETNLIKRFIGKATWDLNQLIDEMNNGFWIPINCNNNELLSKIIFFSKINEEEDNSIASSNNIYEGNTKGRENRRGRDKGKSERKQKVEKSGSLLLSESMSNSYKGEYLWQKIISSISEEYEDISKIPQKVIDNVLKDFRGMEND